MNNKQNTFYGVFELQNYTVILLDYHRRAATRVIRACV